MATLASAPTPPPDWTTTPPATTIPLPGQFTSADTVLAAKKDAIPTSSQLNRYAYVAGNPETKTDPTGHHYQTPPGGGSPQVDPNPGRPNYHNDFVRDYWTDVTGGDGSYNDFLFKLSIKKSLDRGTRSPDQLASDALEAQDGPILAAWFGLTMWHTPDMKGAGGPSPDYYVGINQGAYVSGLGPLTVADVAQTKYATAIDLYTPQGDTKWLDLPGGRPAGIIGEAYTKGAQASIIAIDISNKDPNNTLDKATLNAYASQIVFWKPTSNQAGANPSRVMRVIFIRNGQVVDDYNPLNFGPPNRETRPPQIILD